MRLSDIEGISLLIAGLEGSDKIISDVTQYTQAKRDPNNEGGTPISAVVAKCSDQVVGVAVVRTEEVIQLLFVVLFCCNVRKCVSLCRILLISDLTIT